MLNLKSNITIDKSNDLHNYLDKNNNVINLPSVTKLVGNIYPFDISKIDPSYLNLSRIRGNCCHKRIELYIKYKLVTPCKCEEGKKTHNKLFEKLRIFINNILKKYEIVAIYSELSLKCNWYLGTIDLVLVIKENDKLKVIIVDFKTTSWKLKKTDDEKNEMYYKEALQLYLYAKLIEHNFGLKFKMLIIMNPNKTFYSYRISDEQINLSKKCFIKLKRKYGNG